MRVPGHCPMGCGETLALFNRLRCMAAGCPRPHAVSEILADSETEHTVTFARRGWTLTHPLRERLDGGPAGCVHELLMQNMEGAPAPFGRYRVTIVDADATFEPLPAEVPS